MPGTLYLLRSNADASLHKIGITNHWRQRAKQLEVGLSTACIGRWLVNDSRQLERFLHRRFKPHRLPQSEWFHLSPDQVAWVVSAASKAADDLKQATNHQPRPTPAATPPAAAPGRPRPQTYQPDPTPAARPQPARPTPTAAEKRHQQRQRLIRQSQRFEDGLIPWWAVMSSLVLIVCLTTGKSLKGDISALLASVVFAPIAGAPLAVLASGIDAVRE